ncbi:unnamed protein product [Closterium sp. NIES-65]|nr:unnamed protein product [Closterium sp. NIES-65]
MGPGIWRLPSADTAKPGVERVIKAVVERHHAEASGNFGGLLTKLKAALRRYAAEERKRIRATLRHLELAVSGLQQELMRNPLRDDLRVTLAERESQLAAYLKGENDRLHLLAGIKEETKGEIASGKPDMPKTLRDREKEELEADWTEEEVKKALKEMACDKSPGGDGLPKELFERHWDLLRKDFMGFIKQFESSAVLPEEVQEVVTILLYKKGPREQVHNYRPITLLSSCYKVVAKLLANRMKQVLGTVISEEQHRFLPGRRLSDAVSTVADVIEAANNDKEDWYLLMIDFQKVFDSVSRSFLFDTMALMGFPSKFIRWCEGLHDGSFTRLLVNGWLGDRVDVRKGVRQGCPLAPYLFLCAVEPICQEAKPRKLGINDHHGDRLAYLGYADDTTLVLKGKRQIERAEELLEEFGARSGLRVNKDKSALLPLGANLKETRSVSSDFAWVNPKDAERLLGVWVSPSRSAEVTWDKALARAAEELVKWQSHHLTTTARVAVFGVPLVGVAETTAVLPLDKVEPLMVRGGRVIGAGGLHEVRLCCSELCMEDQVPPLKQLRLLFGAQQGVMQQQEKWSDEWGSVIDWKRVITVRDSAVLPNRARDVLLCLHCRNLQVGVRLKFLEGVACQHCGEEETAEHCFCSARRAATSSHSPESLTGRRRRGSRSTGFLSPRVPVAAARLLLVPLLILTAAADCFTRNVAPPPLPSPPRRLDPRHRPPPPRGNLRLRAPSLLRHAAEPSLGAWLEFLGVAWGNSSSWRNHREGGGSQGGARDRRTLLRVEVTAAAAAAERPVVLGTSYAHAGTAAGGVARVGGQQRHHHGVLCVDWRHLLLTVVG